MYYFGSIGRTSGGGSPLSILSALVIGWIAHFFVSENVVVITGVVVFFLCQIALNIAMHYYGFIAQRYKTALWQKVVSVIGWGVVVLLIIEAIKQFHG